MSEDTLSGAKPSGAVESKRARGVINVSLGPEAVAALDKLVERSQQEQPGLIESRSGVLRRLIFAEAVRSVGKVYGERSEKDGEWPRRDDT